MYKEFSSDGSFTDVNVTAQYNIDQWLKMIWCHDSLQKEKHHPRHYKQVQTTYIVYDGDNTSSSNK